MAMALSCLPVLLLLVPVAAMAASCPCEDQSLCEIITTSPRKEILGFVISDDNWPRYNWSVVTTLAMFTTWNSSLLCYAHSKGVRVVMSASYSIADLNDAAKRSEWVMNTLQTVQNNFADGINVDIEGATQNSTDQSSLLTLLMSEVHSAFKSTNKNYQVTFDVAWSPHCVDGRCYQYDMLAKYTDFLVIMAYDERSQIYGPCIASANSALPTTAYGIEEYLKLGISADQLVLGLPWYGYDYPCLHLSEDHKTCSIPHVPFRGVNCSDAAGKQINYDAIHDLIRAHTAIVRWNETLETPYFNYKNQEDKLEHQVWYDDPKSLSLKYVYAGHVKNLRGLAFWNLDALDYYSSRALKQTAEMWEAIANFF